MSESKIISGQEWAVSEDRQSPEHYCVTGRDLVAVVEYGARTATIEVCGDLRYIDRQSGDDLRTCDDLYAYGIRTDADLEAALRQGRLECYNNPWYEVRCDSEYSEPCFSQADCLSVAEEMLRHPLDPAANVRTV